MFALQTDSPERPTLEFAEPDSLPVEGLEDEVGRGAAFAGGRRLSGSVSGFWQRYSAEAVILATPVAGLHVEKAGDDRNDQAEGQDKTAQPTRPFAPALWARIKFRDVVLIHC